MPSSVTCSGSDAASLEKLRRPSRNPRVAACERDRFVSQGSRLLVVALGVLELGEFEPKRRIVGVDPQRLLERMGCCGEVTGRLLAPALLEQLVTRAALRRVAGGLPARRNGARLCRRRLRCGQARAAGEQQHAQHAASRRGRATQCNAFRNHWRSFEVKRILSAPQATARGGRSSGGMASCTASGQLALVSRPV